MNIHLMSRPISFQPVGRCAIFGFVFLGHKITRCISHMMRHTPTDSVPVGWSGCAMPLGSVRARVVVRRKGESR
jgi:hypothetical protein